MTSQALDDVQQDALRQAPLLQIAIRRITSSGPALLTADKGDRPTDAAAQTAAGEDDDMENVLEEEAWDLLGVNWKESLRIGKR